MRSPALYPHLSLCQILAVALLCLSASPAAVASSKLPSAIPGAFQPSTQKDYENPEITKPHDPHAKNCLREVTDSDRANARLGSSNPESAKINNECLPQADAFMRAAEASTYLAHYYQRYTPFVATLREHEAKNTMKVYQDKIRNCVSGGPCSPADRAEVMKALVQYNFGKEIRAQVLEGRHRAELMKSVDLSAQDWRDLGVRAPKILASDPKRGSLKTGTLRKNTFRLDPNKLLVVDLEKLSPEQQMYLGSRFMHDYGQFVDAYSKTTQTHSRWHYVKAKTTAVGSGAPPQRIEADGMNLDARLGKTRIDRSRQEADARSQNQQSVNEIVSSFKHDYRKAKVWRDGVDPNDADAVKEVETHRVAVRDMGLGLVSIQRPDKTWAEPKDVAAEVVTTINKAIHEVEQETIKKKSQERLPSSGGSVTARVKDTPTVQVDIERFDKFLDTIWPSDIAARKP